MMEICLLYDDNSVGVVEQSENCLGTVAADVGVDAGGYCHDDDDDALDLAAAAAAPDRQMVCSSIPPHSVE